MNEPAPRKASPIDVAKAVFWSFLGIRKRSALETDALKLSPVQVVVAGLVGAILFILVLVLIVKFVISRAGL